MTTTHVSRNQVLGVLFLLLAVYILLLHIFAEPKATTEDWVIYSLVSIVAGLGLRYLRK